MTFNRIDLLVTRHDFRLQAWNDRYSKGVWVVCTPNAYQGDAIRESSEDGDLDMIPCIEYVLGTDWLPIEIGRSLVDAMAALEARLSRLPTVQLSQGSEWAVAVTSALERLRAVRRESKDYGGTEGRLLTLPATFAALKDAENANAGERK